MANIQIYESSNKKWETGITSTLRYAREIVRRGVDGGECAKKKPRVRWLE